MERPITCHRILSLSQTAIVKDDNNDDHFNDNGQIFSEIVYMLPACCKMVYIYFTQTKFVIHFKSYSVNGEKCIMRIFMICTLHQIFLR
jgi:hypothetical protein